MREVNIEQRNQSNALFPGSEIKINSSLSLCPPYSVEKEEREKEKRTIRAHTHTHTQPPSIETIVDNFCHVIRVDKRKIPAVVPFIAHIPSFGSLEKPFCQYKLPNKLPGSSTYRVPPPVIPFRGAIYTRTRSRPVPQLLRAASSGSINGENSTPNSRRVSQLLLLLSRGSVPR